MKRNQSKEDYLEAILILSQEQEYVHQIEVARKIGVSQPAVQKALKILKAEELILVDGLHIYLTARGKAYAEEVFSRHKIIRDFLVLHGVDFQTADEDACEMEHAISEKTFNVIKLFVEKNKNAE
ncbi:MAG: metal-dependent transcriptional regulator [Clostridia bacterium]|nr:metal-dependent transcriptional regulator [Clostridia bacterium]